MFKTSTIPALAAALGLSATAPAAIVYFNPEPDIPIPTTYEGVSIDLETGAVSNALEGLPGGDANFFFGGAELSNDGDIGAAVPSWQPVRSGTGNTDAVLNLPQNAVVGPGNTYSTGFGGSGDPNSHFPNFTPDTLGYLGFSLILNDSSTVYGYMAVTLQDDGVTPGTVHGWAYEDSGSPITIGIIPEPSGGVLALLGLATLALRRRR